MARVRRGRVTSHMGPRRRSGGGGRHVACEGAGMWRAHRLVGPGEIIGAVTQMRYAPIPFILADSSFFFFRVGLCSRRFLTFSGDVVSRGASDAIEMMKIPQSRGLRSTRSPSQARAQRETIDRVSGHRTVKL